MNLYQYLISRGMPERLSDDEQGKWLWERDRLLSDRLHCLEDLELAMQAEIERLRSIVAMMPTTADGVTITQGTTVYVLGYKDEPIEVVVEEMRLYEGGDWWLDGSGVYPSWQPQFCYSTLEAARNGGA